MPAFDLATALPAAADAFRNAERITAICHATPDADTIGGASAVAIMARRLGKEAEIVSTDRPAPVFNFLEGIPEARTAPTLEPDLAVICDAATLERVGPIARDHAEWFSRTRILNVDHHISNDAFGDVNLVDPHAAATCQVLTRLVRELRIELDAPLASALLTGIVRDSQGFSDKSTTSETLRIAADLVDAGAPIADIHRLVLIELPYPTLALWGRMLARIGERQNGRVVYATLTQEMLDETGTQQHDADGLAEFLARAKEAEVTLLLRELGPHETRVSVRCADGVDATKVAAPFGGGGHRSRSGATVRAPLDEAVSMVLDVAEQSVLNR